MNNRRRGVTLIEMLVVVTIIALFASVVIVRYYPHITRARQVAASVQIQQLENALGAYKIATGNFPTNEQGLAALRPYLAHDLPLDPWGRPYLYRNSPAPEILSYGADGRPGGSGEDADIISSQGPLK